MCLKTAESFLHYTYCPSPGHTLPAGACLKYSPALSMCLDDPTGTTKLDIKKMTHGGLVYDKCIFCKAGKNLDGACLYGEGWEGREGFRKKW
ncbi:hypothetical protein EKO04_009702 [Ascochyta lentis]|uniref:Uncharacterized protein n=1 Tax=Ascochyta lentis TaxID=205686 RepID=A0A8H7MDR9_9PLEO|nr:hypothetical protein EKO04_009702 [Ascochyta lentis]